MTTFYTAPEGAEIIAQRCENARKTTDGWQAACPAHEDRTPSLSITPIGARVLLHCHAGCAVDEVVAALGLTMAELFVSPPSRRSDTRRTTPPSHTASPPPPAGPPRVTATYDYPEVDSALLFQVLRWEPGFDGKEKSFTQRRPDPHRPGVWIDNMHGVTKVLYNLPAVLRAVQTGEIIYLPEGEKDAQNLIDRHLTATTNAGGAGKWEPQYTDTLCGAHVVILQDNDASGRRHTARVTQALHGVAASLQVVELPDLPPKGDVSDWLAAGGTRAQLEALVAQTSRWTPAAVRPQESAPAARHGQLRHPGRQSEAATSPRPDEPPLPYSDYTNALALVCDHGQDLRYCWSWGKWLCWTGTHWQLDTTGAVIRAAKQTIKRLARHAEALDDDAAGALLKHVKASLATAKLKAMVESAQSEPSIPIEPAALDADRWLLNCTNGTVNLQTGTLQPHARTDLLTRCIAVPYDAAAPCPTWDAFLDRIMAGNQPLIRFLQRVVGYGLTGEVSEQCLLIFWGSGANGKSTFLNTLLALLGPYAMKATAELLLVTQNDRHPTERADLFGKRFVAAMETAEGARLNEVFVKEATGGDLIRARRMREDFWQFTPTHKVVLATNHKPVIRGTDHAVWRRIKLLPFTVTIPEAEKDKTLPDKLLAELPGILAWAVRGCLAWQHDSLWEPDEVTAATAGYRTEMDVLGAFLAECCLMGPQYRTKASELYDAYKAWCDATGEYAHVQRNFGLRLAERGCERQRGTAGSHWWRGLGLSTNNLPAPATRAQDTRAPQVTEVTDSDPISGINGVTTCLRGTISKLGSLGSLGSLRVEELSTAPVPPVPAAISTPPDIPPCAICGGTMRWHDVAASRPDWPVWRCVACHPRYA